MSTQAEARYELIDFVEQHGGSLSGEKRDELMKLVHNYGQEFRNYFLEFVQDAEGHWVHPDEVKV